MIEHLGLLFYGNIMITLLVYFYVFRIRKLIGFQLGMNLSTLVGGFLAIISGVVLIYQFPLMYVWITMITTLIGMIFGALVGGLFDYQTLLTGYVNGMMMGIMAPMVGAAAKGDPVFLVFLEGIFVFSLILFVSSTRQT
ncbi:hypothetical protein [Bacillus sp. CHD6a]|uniref:hypothetical protein n=1 Tax=Bacillus sp. CHD6a TaxID=1643452 RepID=UPI000A7C708F|nr:hypothetical protein [Bacillus sp. CHD6a]